MLFVTFDLINCTDINSVDIPICHPRQGGYCNHRCFCVCLFVC